MTALDFYCWLQHYYLPRPLLFVGCECFRKTIIPSVQTRKGLHWWTRSISMTSFWQHSHQRNHQKIIQDIYQWKGLANELFLATLWRHPALQSTSVILPPTQFILLIICFLRQYGIGTQPTMKFCNKQRTKMAWYQHRMQRFPFNVNSKAIM